MVHLKHEQDNKLELSFQGITYEFFALFKNIFVKSDQRTQPYGKQKVTLFSG